MCYKIFLPTPNLEPNTSYITPVTPVKLSLPVMKHLVFELYLLLHCENLLDRSHFFLIPHCQLLYIFSIFIIKVSIFFFKDEYFPP